MLLAFVYFTLQLLKNTTFLSLSFQSVELPFILKFSLLLAGYFLSILIHESGHFIAGILVGFKARLLQIGPVCFEQKNNKWKLHFKINSFLGGAAIVLPKTYDDSTMDKYFIAVISGPIFSLASTAIFLYLANYNLTSNYEFKFFMSALTLINFCIFLATTVPKYSGYTYTDRARAMRILSKNTRAEEEALMRTVLLSENHQALNENDISTLESSSDENVKDLGLIYRYHCLVTSKMQGSKHLEKQIQELSKLISQKENKEYLLSLIK